MRYVYAKRRGSNTFVRGWRIHSRDRYVITDRGERVETAGYVAPIPGLYFMPLRVRRAANIEA